MSLPRNFKRAKIGRANAAGRVAQFHVFGKTFQSPVGGVDAPLRSEPLATSQRPEL